MINLMSALYHPEGEEAKTTSPVDYITIWDEEARIKLDEKQQKETQGQSVDDMKGIMLAFAKVHNEKEAKKNTNPIKAKK